MESLLDDEFISDTLIKTYLDILHKNNIELDKLIVLIQYRKKKDSKE